MDPFHEILSIVSKQQDLDVNQCVGHIFPKTAL